MPPRLRGSRRARARRSNRRLLRGAGFGFALLKFLRECGVAQRLGVEIDQMKPDAVLNLALTQVTQTRRPLPVLHQIIRYVLREENVPGVAAIHHPLRHVDAGPAMLVRPLTSVTSLTGPL